MSQKKFAALVGLSVASITLLAGCTPPGSGPDAAAQDDTAPITVWVDDTRAADAKAWADAHPDADVTVQTIDNTAGAVSQKIALALKAGTDIPDVIFLSTPDEVSNLITNQVPYALDLTGAVDQDVLDGFADGAIDRCTFEGKVFCLPNDLAPTVLYYNKKLFDEFGYQVPKTFDEFVALGERVGAEHPGYSLGTVNGRYGSAGYFGSSGCPLNESTSATEARIDTSVVECTRVIDAIAPLLKNGTLSTLDFFDPAYTPTIAEGKMLAAVAPLWMGEYGLKPLYKTEGDYAVAATPAWDEATGSVAGPVGGGLWLAYAGTANKKLVTEFLAGITSNVELAKTATGYPAAKEVADAWLSRVATDKWYAQDPSDVLRDAVGTISPAVGYVRYQVQLDDIYGSTIVAHATGDLSAQLKELGDKAKAAAESAGYTVNQ